MSVKVASWLDRPRSARHTVVLGGVSLQIRFAILSYRSNILTSEVMYEWLSGISPRKRFPLSRGCPGWTGETADYVSHLHQQIRTLALGLDRIGSTVEAIMTNTSCGSNLPVRGWRMAVSRRRLPCLVSTYLVSTATLPSYAVVLRRRFSKILIYLLLLCIRVRWTT